MPDKLGFDSPPLRHDGFRYCHRCPPMGQWLHLPTERDLVQHARQHDKDAARAAREAAREAQRQLRLANRLRREAEAAYERMAA